MTVAYKNHDLTQAELYRKLKNLYDTNGYYEENIYGDGKYSVFKTKPYLQHKSIVKPLRAVVNRSVEFYVGKICKSMEILSDNDNLIDSINEIFIWSNFKQNKSLAIRQETLYGNLFFKVIGSKDKVYFEVIKTEHVTDIEIDSRGFLQKIRIDIPIKDEFDRDITYTEYWEKQDNETGGYYSIWEHTQGINTKLENLGDPISKGWLIELGILFIPFVQIMFRDTGSIWGSGSTQHCLDKIDEANMQSSRLSDLLFRYNKPVISISSNDKDKMGRPIPQKKLDSDTDLFNKDDESILYLDGLSSVNSLIPDINYADALGVLKDMMDEIDSDLPELRYFNLREGGISGKAVLALMSGAYDRAVEAENNFKAGLKRIIQMGLSLGIYWNIFSPDLGTYNNGDFEFEILTPDIFSPDEEEKSLILKNYVIAGLPLKSSMELLGFSKEFIDSAMAEKKLNPVIVPPEIKPDKLEIIE